MPGPRFRFMIQLGSLDSHFTNWVNDQHRPAGFESRFVPEVPIPLILTLIGPLIIDLVSSPVWREAEANTVSNLYWVQMCNSSIWPINRALSAFTTLNQSVRRRNSKEGVLHIIRLFSFIYRTPFSGVLPLLPQPTDLLPNLINLIKIYIKHL